MAALGSRAQLHAQARRCGWHAFVHRPSCPTTRVQLVGRGSHASGADGSGLGSAAASADAVQLGVLHPAPSSPLSEVPSTASDTTDGATTDTSKLPQGFGEGAWTEGQERATVRRGGPGCTAAAALALAQPPAPWCGPLPPSCSVSQ